MPHDAADDAVVEVKHLVVIGWIAKEIEWHSWCLRISDFDLSL
jgi:hypothetical protein